MTKITKAALFTLIFTAFAASLFAQTPSQVKSIIPGTVSVVFAWDYNTSDEASIDDFVLQRTQFATTSTITSPYAVEQVIPQKTIRTITFTIPSGVTAGQKAFFRILARKQGLADSAPSNIVEIDVLATPPSPVNFRIQ